MIGQYCTPKTSKTERKHVQSIYVGVIVCINSCVLRTHLNHWLPSRKPVGKVLTGILCWSSECAAN